LSWSLVNYRFEIKTSEQKDSETLLGYKIFFKIKGSKDDTPWFINGHEFPEGSTVGVPTGIYHDLGSIKGLEIKSTSTDGWIFDTIVLGPFNFEDGWTGPKITFINGHKILDAPSSDEEVQQTYHGFLFYYNFFLLISPTRITCICSVQLRDQNIGRR